MDDLKLHQARLLARSLRREIKRAQTDKAGPFAHRHPEKIASTSVLLRHVIGELRRG
jgi:hypothetical protein